MDGFGAEFYQQYWNTLGNDFLKDMTSFLSTHQSSFQMEPDKNYLDLKVNTNYYMPINIIRFLVGERYYQRNHDHPAESKQED